MSIHHPALAETGELEIAQRQALHEARESVVEATTREANPDSLRVAIEAYLAAMRRVHRPEAIVIGEGDYVIVEIDGHAVRVEHRTRDGAPLLVVDPEGATYLEGTETAA
jgi:hypothetical protein